MQIPAIKQNAEDIATAHFAFLLNLCSRLYSFECNNLLPQSIIKITPAPRINNIPIIDNVCGSYAPDVTVWEDELAILVK